MGKEKCKQFKGVSFHHQHDRRIQNKKCLEIAKLTQIQEIEHQSEDVEPYPS